MSKLNRFSKIDTQVITRTARMYGTPVYLYDEELIIKKCKALTSMPNAYGLTVRYAMKANSSRALLKIINGQGLKIDASSMNEVRRAALAGIDYGDIILTTQEVPTEDEKAQLQDMILKGLKYNVCSLRQLYNIGDFAAANKVGLAIRVHPGIGSGESATRNTGDKYSCFGVHLCDIDKAIGYAREKGITIDHVHVHIGSGADPDIWKQNIKREIDILEKHFPDAGTISFGGGLKEARMPDEDSFDIQKMGDYARQEIEKFHEKSGRKLHMEIEPGTYTVANAGYIIAGVIDKKKTGESGFNFVVLNGGLEMNSRPLMYGSLHPFYVVSRDGRLISAEFSDNAQGQEYKCVLVGKCCENGDSQCLDQSGVNTPRNMGEPDIGDYVVIGGAGAYCASMAPFNYNSHVQAPEVLLTSEGELRIIRRKQTLEQITANEV